LVRREPREFILYLDDYGYVTTGNYGVVEKIKVVEILED